MQCDGGVEVGLFCSHLDGNSRDLGDFGRAFANHMAADDTIGQAVDHELHQDAGVAAG
jgi:hypothetical protein